MFFQCGGRWLFGSNLMHFWGPVASFLALKVVPSLQKSYFEQGPKTYRFLAPKGGSKWGPKLLFFCWFGRLLVHGVQSGAPGHPGGSKKGAPASSWTSKSFKMVAWFIGKHCFKLSEAARFYKKFLLDHPSWPADMSGCLFSEKGMKHFSIFGFMCFKSSYLAYPSGIFQCAIFCFMITFIDVSELMFCWRCPG